MRLMRSFFITSPAVVRWSHLSVTVCLSQRHGVGGGPMLLLPGAALGIKQAFSAYPPSSFEFPGTFEHVCVQRGLPPEDDVQVIFASPPDTETPAQGVRGRRGTQPQTHGPAPPRAPGGHGPATRSRMRA